MLRTFPPLALALAVVLFGPAAGPPPVMPPPACEEAPYRQFDFWLGDWSVTDSAGTPLGTSRITAEAGGCALREAWSGGAQFSGTSLNYYTPADGRWHQHWAGSDGLVLHLTGGRADGAMVLEGARTTPDGPILDRIAWRPLDGGVVRQEWTISSDGGGTWSRAFLGFYRPD